MKETETRNVPEHHNYRIRGLVNGTLLGLSVGFPIVVGRIFPEAAYIAGACVVAPILCPLKWIREDLKEINNK